MRKFEKYEIELLESYWIRLKELEMLPALEKNPYLNSIVEGLNKLFSTLDDYSNALLG